MVNIAYFDAARVVVGVDTYKDEHLAVAVQFCCDAYPGSDVPGAGCVLRATYMHMWLSENRMPGR